MGRAAEAGFTFNIHDAGLPHADTRSDAGRTTEAVIAELEHRQSIHLSDLMTIYVNENGAFSDEVTHLFFDAIGAKHTLVDRFLYMLCGHCLALFFTRPIGGLAHQVCNLRTRRRNFLSVSDSPRAEFHQPFDAYTSKMR